MENRTKTSFFRTFFVAPRWIFTVSQIGDREVNLHVIVRHFRIQHFINCQILNCPGSSNGGLPREIASWRSTANRVRLPPGHSPMLVKRNMNNANSRCPRLAAEGAVLSDPHWSLSVRGSCSANTASTPRDLLAIAPILPFRHTGFPSI